MALIVLKSQGRYNIKVMHLNLELNNGGAHGLSLPNWLNKERA